MKVRAGKTAHLVKCVLCEPEDLWSDPSNPVKSWGGVVTHTVVLVLENWSESC